MIIDLALEAIATEKIVTTRRVLYLAIEHGLANSRGRPLDKAKGSYGTVIDAMGMARRSGLIPWAAVADTTDRIEPPNYDGPEDFQDAVVGLAKRYMLDRQAGAGLLPGGLVGASRTLPDPVPGLPGIRPAANPVRRIGLPE